MPSILAPVAPAFRALATTIVPEAEALDPRGWRELERIVEDALGRRPRGMRRQLVLLIRLLDVQPLFRYHKRFTTLDAGRRTLVLRRLERSRLLLLRRGIWGLRTLVFMGYYARPAAAAEIGYRADPRGWAARRGMPGGAAGGGDAGAEAP